MLVYRWEHAKTGQGPYNPGIYAPRVEDLAEDLRASHGGWANQDHHLPAGQDGLDWGSVADGWVCACPTLEDLDEWFEGFADERLRAAGFLKCVYEVSQTHYRRGYSGIQCAFRKDRAKLVQVL